MSGVSGSARVLCGWLASVAIAGLALGAGADGLGGIATPLPPGARSSLDGVVMLPPASAGDPGRLVERIPHAGSKGAARHTEPEWIEIEYTVDPRLEERARATFGRLGIGLGHTIVLDPHSGKVFAYVSTAPDVFPPTRAYPTASLMKVVTAAATLRTRPEATERNCRYLGSPYLLIPRLLRPPPAGTPGSSVDSFRRALAISNNQCFARLAVNELGEAALLSEIERLGMLEAPALRHAAGEVEPPRDELDLGFLGSGLAGSYITPLGAARLAALLAEGTLVQPFWIAGARDARGNPVVLPGRGAPRLVWTPQLTQTLRSFMEEVTESGTARRAFRSDRGEPLLGPIRVSGKTGTLHGTEPDGRYQWFIGVAPADAPRVAIASVVVNRAADAASAADVSAALLREVFCEEARCDASRVERLHLRDRTRAAETRRAIRDHARSLKRAEEIARTHEVVDLDRPPRPLGGTRLEFPRRLLRDKVRGEIVVLVTLDPAGRVRDASVAASDLPDFEEFVLAEVKGWSFSPPTRHGRPVHARARLPIPIHIH